MVDLPDKVTKIDVIFRKNEWFMFGMVFYGSTVVNIGWTGELEGRRVETTKFAPDEELLGCEIHHCEHTTLGVTWITWCRPQLTSFRAGEADRTPKRLLRHHPDAEAVCFNNTDDL